MSLVRAAPIVLLAAFAGAVPGVAAAQAPPPADGLFKIVPERVGGHPARVLTGQRFRVRGVIEPYVAGQKATVRFYRHGRKLLAREVALLPSRTGQSGYFVLGFATVNPGRVVIRATHLATPQQVQLRANPKGVDVLAPAVGPGGRGPLVRLLQRRLAALHYVVGQRGVYDDRTARAVMAFRKTAGLARTYESDASVFHALQRGAGAFHVHFPSHGRHVEANISRQVLALIGAGGSVERIYPMSSGAPGTPTVLGSFHVYLKSPGFNAKGMYFSNYFIGGYAIHGYFSVPPYNASHGCLRVPIPDAVSIYGWIRGGTIVDVYR